MGLSKKKQLDHYKDIIVNKRKSKFIFSCGYKERFDPFIFDKEPGVRKNFENVFQSIFSGNKYEHILDVGCGTALYFPILSQYACRITGIDFSKEMVQEAKKLIKDKKISNCIVEIGDAEKLRYKDKSFDCVICFDALHHIPDINCGLKEISRVLKGRGVFIAVEPNMFNPLMLIAHLIPWEERGAVKRNYAHKLKKEMQKFFSDVKISHINYIASVKNKTMINLISLLNKDIDKKFHRHFSMRYILYAKKQ